MGTESIATETDSIICANRPTSVQSADQYRMQLYNYALQAERLRFVQNYVSVGNPVYSTYTTSFGQRWQFPISFFQNRLTADEPKPQHSYIGLIAMAILSSPDAKLVLSDIYQYILDNYPYFRSRGPGWRNSIRHNLSLNDCFIKAGRSANGKGHYWAIHPANIEDFKKGDFRRRKAQRKVRKHMGLTIDDDNDSPSPPPLTPPPNLWSSTPIMFPSLPINISRKRQFDVASLLAPDDNLVKKKQFAFNFASTVGEKEPDDGTKFDNNTNTASDNLSQRLPNLESSTTNNNNNSSNITDTPLNLQTISSWSCPTNLLQIPSSEHQQFVVKYYEHLNQVRTVYSHQQLQIPKKFNINLQTGKLELDNNT